MRISSNTIYQSGLNNMQDLQASIYKLTMQIDNQQRVVTPADDPVAAARILLLSQSQGQNSQYITNTQAVSSWLSLSETAVKSSSDLMASMKSLAISAGSGALSSTELQAIQKQLQEGITELTTYANSTDGRGNYLFSGNKTDTVPYVVSLSAVPPATYQGDTGQRSVQISASQQMTISDPGSTVFGTPGQRHRRLRRLAATEYPAGPESEAGQLRHPAEQRDQRHRLGATAVLSVAGIHRRPRPAERQYAECRRQPEIAVRQQHR